MAKELALEAEHDQAARQHARHALRQHDARRVCTREAFERIGGVLDGRVQLRSEVHTGITMKGSIDVHQADDDGGRACTAATQPRAAAAACSIGPLRPSSMLQPKARTTSEIGSGEQHHQQEHRAPGRACGSGCRLRAADQRTQIVVSAEIHRVRQKISRKYESLSTAP